MNTEKVKIDELKFDPDNVRKHDDNSIKAIANSLSAFGQRKPIVIDQTNTVIAGNGTLKAGIYLGLKELDCVRVPDDWSKEKIKAFAIADNKTHDLSEFDNELLLNTLQDLNEFEIEVTGFEADELEDLMMFKKNPFKTIKIDFNECFFIRGLSSHISCKTIPRLNHIAQQYAFRNPHCKAISFHRVFGGH